MRGAIELLMDSPEEGTVTMQNAVRAIAAGEWKDGAWYLRAAVKNPGLADSHPEWCRQALTLADYCEQQ